MTCTCLDVFFDKELLPSFGTNHVQFLFFYITSLQPEFPQIFLERLWKKVTCMGTSTVHRIQAMSYIAGLLSHAKFISLKYEFNFVFHTLMLYFSTS